MSQNLTLDPVKKDYVVIDGSPIPSDRVEEACYFALTIPQGKWLYGAAAQGSLLWTLANRKRLSSTDQNYAAYATDAINTQVVAAGKATAVAVENLAASRTGTSNQIEVIPAATQVAQQLNFVSV